MANNVSVVHASQDLTLTGNLSNAETITIGSKTYTLQATLTDSDGNVHVGADAEGTIENLVAAVNLSDEGESSTSAGTDYAASMTRNPDVWAEKISATVLRVHAGVPGSVGNHIPSTETSASASWGAATLAGGTGIVLDFIEGILELNQVNAEVQYELKQLTPKED